jgi:hypothetical protein
VRQLWKYNFYGVLEEPPPPPPTGTVTITGPTKVRSNAYCTWYATTDMGSPPLTYTWKVGNSTVPGNGNELTWKSSS